MSKFFKVETDQEAFDAVKSHLLAQGTRCGTDTDCYYDGSQCNLEFAGMKCAIGAIMTDEALAMYGKMSQDVRALLFRATDDGWDVGSLSEDMLSHLQKTHDFGEDWTLDLVNAAHRYKLRY